MTDEPLPSPLLDLETSVMIELTITALSHSADGVARHEGRVVFVPFALPGETVRAEIVEEKKGYARARLVEVITPSPDRIAPRCPNHFHIPSSPHSPASTACGGCQLQHLAYPAQLRHKTQTVIEQLTRIAGMSQPPVRECLPSPAPFGYRNHIQLSLTAEGALGYRAAERRERSASRFSGASSACARATQSRAIVPIRECPIARPELMEVFASLKVESASELERVSLRAGVDDVLVVFEGAAPEVEIDLPVSAALLRPDGGALPLAGRDYVLAEVGGREFKVSAGSFFQVNGAVAALMVEAVLRALELRGGETVLDVYSGVGLFTAFIAPLAGRVIGIESFEPAVEDAAINLDEFDNIELYCAPVEAVLPALDVRAEAVLLDPPRAGCSAEVVEALLKMRAPRVVYVSCDPATFARDAKRLLAGGYTLDFVQPLDMFPQTHHIECVARFTPPRPSQSQLQ
jgi:23S rRNA (uracil1939-C5)-methyltransferase